MKNIEDVNSQESDEKMFGGSTKLIEKVCSTFDINSYEAKVWLTLLSRGALDASRISEASGVPRSRTYDVLESLEKKGFVILKIAKPITYASKYPEEIIETLKLEEKEELKNRVEILNKLKEDSLFSELNSLFSKDQDSADITKILSTQENIDVYENIREMIRNSIKSIKIIASVQDIYSILDNTGGTLYSARRRDVNIKIIAIGNRDETLNKFFGEENMKYTKELNFKTIIVDEREINFGIKKNYDKSLWANSNFVGNGFSKLFDLVWDKLKRKEVIRIN